MSNQMTDIAGDHKVVTTILGQATAGTPDEWPIFQADAPLRITGVRWVPAAAVAGVATNNFALHAQNRGPTGAGVAQVTTPRTYAAGVNSVAFDGEDLPLTAAVDLTAGDVLTLVRAVNGTGLAQPDGLVEVRFRYR